MYFVFIGTRLPKYAAASLDLANKFSGLRINLIGSSELSKQFNNENVNFIDIGQFYDSSSLIRASSNLVNSHTFRQGLWLKSLERFFVLEQFMKFTGIESLFHAELDQLLFGVDTLLSNLELINVDGMYLPYHKPNAAVASLVYIRNSQTLTSLIEFANSNDFSNEMQLIANWGMQECGTVVPLPTLASKILCHESVMNSISLVSEQIGGVVDAAQLGQWVAGIDPRNVPIRTKPVNKFVDTESKYLLDRESLNKIKFNFDVSKNILFVTFGDSAPIRLFNLHIHSKIHFGLLHNNPSISEFFQIANNDMNSEFSGTRSTQVINYLKTRFVIIFEDPKRLRVYLLKRIKLLVQFRKSI